MTKIVEYDLTDWYECGRCKERVPRKRQKISITVTDDDTQRTKIQKLMLKLISSYEDDGSFELIGNVLLPTFLHKCGSIHCPCVLDSIEVFSEKESESKIHYNKD